MSDTGEILVGIPKEWVNPNGKGPGRFKLQTMGSNGKEIDISCQVWPLEYGTEEENPVYADAKQAVFDGAEMTLEGQGEWQTYTIKKGPRSGKEGKSYQFTVWAVNPDHTFEEAMEGEEPGPEGDPAKTDLSKAQETVERILKERQSSRASSGKGQSSSTNGGNGDRMTKEEWADKNRQDAARIGAAWAIGVAVQGLVGNGKEVSADKIESNARALLQIQAKLAAEVLSGSSPTNETPGDE